MTAEQDVAFRQIRIRARESLAEQIERAAEEHGVSMNAEIIDRLQRSFANDQVVGGPIAEDRPLTGIAKMIASAMFDAGRFAALSATGTVDGIVHWHDNPYAYDEAVRAAHTVLEAFRPPGEIKPPQHGFIQNMGEGWGRGVVEQVARGASRIGDVENIGRIASIRADLGPAMLERVAHQAVGGETTNREVWGSKKRKPKK